MVIDVREEISNAPIEPYHCFLAFLVGMILFFDGYDMFNVSYALHYVMKPWHLAASQAGLLISSGLIGMMISSLFQGKLSDRYGRRATLIGALWIASVFSFANGMFAHSFLSFSVFRFLTGIGLGVLMPIGVTYVNEYAPLRLKQTFTAWGWALGFSIGGITASAVGIFLTPSLGWQSLYYVGSLSGLLALVCHFALPESVQFSAMRGQTQDIAKILARLNPAKASRYTAPDVKFAFPEPNNQIASMSLLLSPRYRRTTVSVCLSAFVLLFGVFGLSGWVPTVMIERGETFVTGFGFGALLMMTNFFGTIACGYVSDRHGSGRAALAVWWIGGAISVAILALFNGHVLNAICVGAAGFFLLGGQGALNNLTASWYETEVRGTAVGVMLGIGRLGGVFGPLITGVIQQIVPGAFGLFAAIGASAFTAAVAISFAEPQSWGKPAADLPVSL